MKKVIIFFLITALFSSTIYANPLPVPEKNDNLELILSLTAILTLGLGYAIYQLFANDHKVEFEREEIRIDLQDNNSVKVSGKYYFKRHGNSLKFYDIVYPFPDSREFGAFRIDTLKINNRNIPYQEHELKHYDRITLQLNFEEADDCMLFVSFTQQLEQAHYRYILKSTQKWRKALANCKITIVAPQDFNLRIPGFVFDKEIKEGTKQTKYKMQETDFYPAKDLKFSWLVE